MAEEEWYQTLRESWKPRHVRLLLIGESPPEDGGDPTRRRYFYAERLDQYDNLFRSVVAALYDGGRLSKGDPKTPWLDRLRSDGVYLIDLCSAPVNALTPEARRRTRNTSVEGCVRCVSELAPDGIVICHTPSYSLLAEPLRAASLPLLHEKAIPFPLPNKRKEFVQKVRSAVTNLLPVPP